MSKLIGRIENYWDERSESYSKINRSELESDKSRLWKTLINRHKPEVVGRKLKILDIGTGPGFFAIAMAECGYDVTAIDYTEGMLDEARLNAKDYEVEIQFKQMDAHKLEFEAETFDMIIARNLTWVLERPEEAYKDWHRVLKNGGCILNFDANWYHYLYDEKKQSDYKKDRENTKLKGYKDHYDYEKAPVMEEIAMNLPLSKTKRPQWDAAILLNYNFKKILVEQDMGSSVWDEEEQVTYASTPMFMIFAEK